MGFPRTLRILSARDEFLRPAHCLTDLLSSTLPLGETPTVAPCLLLTVLPKIRQSLPQLPVLLQEDPISRLRETLSQGWLDFFLLALETGLNDVSCLRLARDRLILAVPSQHRLAACKQVAEHGLAGDGVPLLEDSRSVRDQALRICESVGATESVDVRASGLSAPAHTVRREIGITLLTCLSLEVKTCAPSPIAVRPFQQPEPATNIDLEWRRNSSSENEFRSLGKMRVAREQGMATALPRVAGASLGARSFGIPGAEGCDRSSGPPTGFVMTSLPGHSTGQCVPSAVRPGFGQGRSSGSNCLS